MTLPGEKGAYHTLYSSLSSPAEKAEAAAKLADIKEIKRRNAESDRRAQQRYCPHCGHILP